MKEKHEQASLSGRYERFVVRRFVFLIALAAVLSISQRVDFLRTSFSQEARQNPSVRYSFTFSAEWVLDEAGEPTAVLVKGRGNLPMLTKVRLWVQGGPQGRVSVTDGTTEVKTIEKVERVTASLQTRQHLAGGAVFPSLVPDCVTTFEIKTDPIRAGKIVPGRYEVEVEVDTRQRPNLRDLLRGNVKQESVSVFLDWGAPETLATYTNGIRRRFETDINELRKVVTAVQNGYAALQREEATVFDTARLLNDSERAALELAGRCADVVPSEVCPITMDYVRVMHGFVTQAILPSMAAVRREIESEVNHVPLDTPAPMSAAGQLDMLNTHFESIYEHWNLLKADVGQALPDLERAVAFFSALPDKARAFKAAGDAAGFNAWKDESDMELVVLFSDLSATVPAGEAKDLLLNCTRELYIEFAELEFDRITDEALQAFAGELEKLTTLADMIRTRIGAK